MKLMLGRTAFCVLLVAWCRAGTLVHEASLRAKERTNPLENSDEARRAGEKLYERECAACHGRNREGSRRVPPLNMAEVYEAAPGTLFWILRNGSLYKGMPSFAHLPEPERWQIITFLRHSVDR